MTATASAPTPTAASPPRAPLFAKPIPIIGVTGEFGSGKTRFLCSICPGPETLIFDSETSSASYEEIGMRRIDIPRQMTTAKPGGYTQLDTFTWWREAIKSIPPGRFRVIGLDVAEDIEEGLTEWVWQNPLAFNHTRNQYVNASGIYWGDVKSCWKQILLDICSRCEVFAFAVHMGSVWGVDKRPTGAKKPKGKTTLMQLASLFLQLERPMQPDGSRQEVPSARVLKTRLAHNAVVNGGLVTKEILPPRLPEATPEAIRAYIATPADFSKLTAGERALPPVLSADERAQLKLATAQAEAQVEQLRIERLQAERASPSNDGEQAADEAQVEATPPIVATPALMPPANTPTNGQVVAGDGDSTLQEVLAAQPNAPAAELEPTKRINRHLDPDITSSIRALWGELCSMIGLNNLDQRANGLAAAIAKKYGADKTKPEDLTADQRLELETAIVEKVRAAYKERGLASPF